jgi:hypothetical protein
MFLMCIVEFSLLLVAGFALMFRLPLVIRHSVDELSRLFPRYIGPPRFCCILIPIGKAISAETRKIHQVDVLHIGPLSKMLDKTAQHRRLELGVEIGIDWGHGLPCLLRLCERAGEL